MLAVVRADDESLVPPQAAGLALSVARPLPTETASLGFGGSPVGGGDKTPGLHFSAFLHGGGITTLGVRFMLLKRWTRRGLGGVFAVFMPSRNLPRAGRISSRRVHTPPQPLTAHTAAHTPKHGGFSGSMVTMFPAAGSSTPSTLFRQIRRSPLLLRKDTVMPFRLRASTLLRIRWEKLLGVSPSVPTGSIFSNSTLAGALISGCRRSNSKRRKRILSLGCFFCSQSSDSSFQT